MAERREQHPDDLAPQRQARALGDPTRYAIFRYVAEAGGPVTVAALTEHLGLNHNAIRQHLAKLCGAGLLVDQASARAGRGRPAVQYRLSAAATASLMSPTPYEQLSVLLLEVLNGGRTPREVGFDAGRRAETSDAPGMDELARLESELGRRGFQPRRVEGRGVTEFVLDECPFATAALVDPGVVCDLHLGLAEGLAEAAGGGLEVTGLVARDPARAGCRLQVGRSDGPADDA